MKCFTRADQKDVDTLIPRLHDTAGCPTGCTIEQPVVQPDWQPVGCLYTRYNLLSNRLSNRFDNRFDSRLYRVNGVLKLRNRVAVLYLRCARSIIGSRPSDHYFRSVCLFVCLFVQILSQPSLIRFRSN